MHQNLFIHGKYNLYKRIYINISFSQKRMSRTYVYFVLIFIFQILMNWINLNNIVISKNRKLNILVNSYNLYFIKLPLDGTPFYFLFGCTNIDLLKILFWKNLVGQKTEQKKKKKEYSVLKSIRYALLKIIFLILHFATPT